MKNMLKNAACVLLMFLCAAPVMAQKKKSIPQEKDMAAYLMVYFKDDTHGLYMALSKDGRSFKDINNGLPVMAGDTLAEQKGIRDPHIFRGPDGAFYIAMTDLHIFAQKQGLRTTEWERDKSYGWGNNRALVLMKSYDLLHWTHTSFRLDKAFPNLNDIGCAWAPEITYDEQKKKMMVYFTMRIKEGINRIYYSYTDDAFTKLETEPKLLFEYPDGKTCIDGDITKFDGKYHMLYVAHDGEPGIKQAIANTVTGPYTYLPEWIDQEPKACEAPTVYKLIGQKKWIVVYDIYSINPHNFGFSETTDFKTFTPIGHFNGGVMKSLNFSSPKHGAVVHLTKKEAENLAKAWKFDLSFKE
ncbi:hypothetical protein GR160_00350 [Flavobacterium sp. Sd200]|uniref:glycoside hydrolase family 43 protein n=1 Tax=Flavobacterium sp. Sd200 TaxID=2692211 RepID=UPI00136FC510|nr:glycoside hydrolase family 43 protein [Flavobacterium sp. Sd200]MXN89665.1 hypothetical protein [Flavobacterium sp. Sd200]